MTDGVQIDREGPDRGRPDRQGPEPSLGVLSPERVLDPVCLDPVCLPCLSGPCLSGQDRLRDDDNGNISFALVSRKDYMRLNRHLLLVKGPTKGNKEIPR